MSRRVLLLSSMFLGLCLVVGAIAGDASARDGASSGECLRPPRAAPRSAATLLELGERALERLPGDYQIIRVNLSADRPRAVAATYLMRDDLLIVEQTGLIYAMDRSDLRNRWVSHLKAPLHRPPAEGPDHYSFLVKAIDGAYWVHAFEKRNGAENAPSFPARLPFAASSGIASDGSRTYVGSLGNVGDNRTVESVSHVNGRVSWGWRTTGLVWGGPVVDPSNTTLVVAGEDGGVSAIAIGGGYVNAPIWTGRATGAVTSTPAVTPEHVVVGAHDGTIRCFELATGEILWFEGIDGPIRTSPWVLGRMVTEARPAEVEGAPDVEVESYQGIAFVRNRTGLHAFDLARGTPLFQDAAARRPICLTGKWVVTIDRNRVLTFRDSEDDYAVKGRLQLSMFDLVPTNTADGAIYGVTHDGGIVAALPKR